MSQSRQLAAIMFTDIVGYTALMGKDSAKALELIRISKEIQKPLVAKHYGQWIKEMGDGALAKFNTALDAVNCAIDIQKAARAEFNGKLRIGIHSGDITIENDDVYGDGVNVASRLESIADPGGIYISESIEKAIQGQTDLQTKNLGEIYLKNVAYAVRTYAVQGMGLPHARKTSIKQKLRKSKYFGVVIILMTLFFGLTFREFLSFILVRLNISPLWSEIFLYTILMFIPTLIVILFIPRDKSKFFRVTRRVIPVLNGTIVVAVLVFSFWGRELGAMTKVVNYQNENGVNTNKIVVKGDFVKRIYIYPFENISTRSKSVRWMSKGIPRAIKIDLDQHQGVMSHFSDVEISLKEQLRPLKADGNFVIRGTYDKISDTLLVQIDLYNKREKQVSREFRDADFIKLVDRMKVFLMKEVNPIITNYIDMPFSEFVTDNVEAFRRYIEGDFYTAYELDPEFAYAYSEMFKSLSLLGGDEPLQKEVSKQVLKHMQKLPERDQLIVKRYYFAAKGDMEKALSASEKYLLLNPGDKKAVYDHMSFLASHDLFEEAFQFGLEQFIKKFDGAIGVSLLELGLFNNKTDLLRSTVEKLNILLPVQTSESILGFISLSESRLDKAKMHFENALIEEPSLYSVDSMISVIKYMERVGDNKINNFARSIIGTYFHEGLRNHIRIFIKNNQIVIKYGDREIPHTLYMINDSSLYRSEPYIYYTNQPEYFNIFYCDNNDSVLRYEHSRRTQNQKDWSGPFIYFKETTELKLALEFFHEKDFTSADSLFQMVYAQDSGNYYFVKNYLQAIEYQRSGRSPFLLDRKEFWTFVNGDRTLRLEKFDDHYQLIGLEGITTFHLFPTSENELMNDFIKKEKYLVKETNSGLRLESYWYNHETMQYDLNSSWDEL